MLAAPRRRLAALLLGPLMVIGLLLGLASPAGAQTFPQPVGIGATPDEIRTINLYFRFGVATDNIEFPIATGGVGGLTYSVTGNPGLESLGFSFDPKTRIFKGTPTLAGAGQSGDGFAFNYRVGSSAGGGFALIFVKVTVCEGSGNPDGETVCTPPDFAALGLAAALAGQSYTVGTPITALTLPVATGGTGSSPTFIYRLTSFGGLPDGLSFDAATRRLTGTPTTAKQSTLTYRVQDAASLKEFSRQFPLDVNAASVDADTTPPTVTLGTIAGAVIDRAGQMHDITFSEAVAGLAAGDFSASTGITVTAVSGSDGGTDYTLTYTATAASFNLILTAGSVTDLAGNPVAETSITGTATTPLPVITGPVTLSIPENTAARSVLGTYTTTATDSFILVIGNGLDSDLFHPLSGGRLGLSSSSGPSVSFSPDYEAPQDQGADNVYNVIIRSLGNVDGVPQPVTQDLEVEITIINVDEPGAISAITGDAQVGEMLAAGTVTDEDSPPEGTPVSGITHQWQSAVDGIDAAAAVDDAAWPDISGATSATYEPVVGDVGRIIRVVATYTDGEGGGKKVASAATGAVAAAPVTLSTDSTLSALDVSAGTLNPPFDAATDAYAVSVGTDVASVTVTPTTTDDGAAVAVNDVAVASGQPSGAIDLNVGNNIITILVVAEDGTGEQTYTVTVARAVPRPGIALARDTARDGGTNTDRITRNRSIVVTLHADFQNDRDTWEWSSNSGNTPYTTGSNTDRSFDLTASQATYNNNAVRAHQTVNGVVSEFAGLAMFQHDTVKPTISLNDGGTSVTITKGDAYNDPVTADDALDGPIDPSHIVITGGPVEVDTAGEYTLTYNVMDSAGNAADPLTRTVTVSEPTATTPEPPVLSAGTTTHNSIALSWGAVDNADSYTLTRVVGGADVVVFSGNALTATDTGLTPETSYKYVVTVTNSVGTSGSSNEVTARTDKTPDTIAPPVPTITTPSATVNTPSFTIAGTAEAGTTVELFKGGTSTGDTVTADSGSFSFTVTLTEGENSFTATASDGPNTSDASPAILITLDTETPAIEANSFEVTSNPTRTTVSFTPIKEGLYTATAGGQTSSITILSGDLNKDQSITFDIASSSVNAVILSYGGEEVARQTVTRNPITISVGDVTSTSIEILWESRDNVAGYFVHRDGQAQSDLNLIYRDPHTGAINTGLTPGTTYEYYVGVFYQNPSLTFNSNTLTVTTTVPDTEKPVITVNEESFSIELGETYTPFTYSATDDTDGDITGGVIVDGDTVDINVANTYTVTFDVDDAAGNPAVQVTRTVTVADTTAPSITPTGSTQRIELTATDTYTEQGATVTDNDPNYFETVTVSGDTPDTSAIGVYAVLYDAPADAANNTPDQQSIVISVVDTTPPTFDVDGNTDDYSTTVPFGGTYTPDVIANQSDISGIASSEVGGETVNVNASGDYAVTYTVTDNNGQVATITETVTVEDPFVISVGAITDTSIALSWTSVTDATYYKVYRDGRPQGGNIAGTTHIDTVFPGTTYRYHVTAFDGAGVITSSNVVSATSTGTALTTPPAAPVLSVDITLDAIILLSWTAVGNADSYTLTRIVDGGNDVIVLSGTSGLSTDDDSLLSGTEYKYFVTATNTFGESVRSNTVTATTTGTAPDTTPPVITVTPEEITLELNSPAPVLLKGVSTDDGSEITISGTVDVGTVGDYTITYSSTDGTNPAVGKTRIYKVIAATAPPATPALGIASNTHNTIELAWVAVANAETYTLTRIVDGGDNVVVESGDILSATDRNLTPSTNYKYVIVATNTAGTSDPSAEFAASTTAAPVETPAIKTGSFEVTHTANADKLLVTFTALKEGTFTITSSESSDTVVVSAEDVSDSVEKEETITVGFEFDGDVTLSFDSKDVASQSARTLAIKAGTFIATARDDGDVTVSFVPLRAGTFVIQAVGAPSVDWLIITNEVGSLTPFIALLTGHGFIGEIVISFGGHEYARESVSTIPGTPTLVKGDITHNSVVFSWDEQTGATGYTLSRTGGTGPTEIAVTGTSYDDTLEPETTYTYSIRAVSIAGDSAASDVVSVTTLAAPTVAPTVPEIPVLSVDSTTDTTISLSWVAVDDADSYTVTRIVAGGNVDVPITELTATDTGLTADTEYKYTIIATNSVGPSASSNEVTATTTTAPDTTSTPLPPTLRVGAITPTSITIEWDAVDDAVSYLVYDDPAAATNEYIDLASVTSSTITGLAPETSYTFYVRSLAADLTSGGISAGLTARTADAPPIPGTPALALVTVTHDTIALSWGPVTGADSYTLTRVGTGDVSDVVVASKTTELTATDTGLTAGTDYNYIITATNSGGTSGPSAEFPASTDVTPDEEKPVITVSGSSETIERTATNTYTIPSATVADNDTNYSGTVAVTGDTPDTSVVGVYTVTYTAPADAAGNTPDQKSIVITVIDTTKPVITVDPSTITTLLVGSAQPDLLEGVSTDDASPITTSGAVDIDISGTYIITYDSTDASGNAANSVTRTYTVIAIFSVANTDGDKVTITFTSSQPANFTLERDGATSDFSTDRAPYTRTETVGYDYTGDIVISIKGGAEVARHTVTTGPAPDTEKPVITVNEESFSIELGKTYTPFTFTAADNIDGDITGGVSVGGDTVDTGTVGAYDVTFDVDDAAGNHAETVTRTVTVTADVTAPSITVNEESFSIELGETYTPFTYSAADNIDGDITSGVTVGGDTVDTGTVGAYDVTFDVDDATGNPAVTVTRTVTVTADVTAPSITVNEESFSIELGETYTPFTYSAADNIDGDITGGVTVGGDTVDTGTVGAYDVTFDVDDAAGNPAVTVTRTVTVTADVTAPSVPAITTPPATVNTPSFTIDGTAEAGATIELFKGGTSTGDTVIADSGSFSFTVTLTDGENSFTVTASDGPNTSDPSPAVLITLDTETPAVPAITTPPATVNTSSFTIAGTAEAGSTVELFNGATSAGTTTADGSGSFSFAGVALSEGANSFTATASDGVNTSAASPAIVITLDTETPEAPAITTLPETVNSPSITINGGSTEAGATVELFNGATSVGTTTADGLGNFSFTVTLTEGENSFTATASDGVNTSVPSPAVVITLDTTKPVITVNPLTVTLQAGSSPPDLLEGVTTDDGSTVTPTGTVDVGTLGDYMITYDSTDGTNTADSVTRTYTVTDIPDTIAPMVTLGSITEGVIGTAQDHDITFSEPVTGLAVDDFSTSTDATVNGVSGSGTTYTITFTPNAATFSLILAANSVSDTADTPNMGPASAASASGTATEPPNQPPTANAGGNQTVDTGALVTLDGSGSNDPDVGDTLSYAWTHTLTNGTPPAPEAVIALTGADTAGPTFTPTAAGVLTFSLTVTDNADSPASHTDTVVITVTGPAADKDVEVILSEVARAIADQNISAIVGRVERARTQQNGGSSFNFAGQQMSFNGNGDDDQAMSSTVANLMNTHASSMEDGTLDMKTLLGNSAFTMPLNFVGSEDGSGITFWGSGDYRNFGGEDEDLALDWDGDMFSVHFGLDGRTAEAIGGLALSWNEGELETDKKETYDISLTSINPYFGWGGARGEVWMTAGYGSGELKRDNGAGATSGNDLSMNTFAIGGNGIVRQRGASTLRLKGEVSQSTLEVDANKDGSGLKASEVDTNRVRLSLESTNTIALDNGARTERSAEAGIRHDGGDGTTGSGAELGFGISHVNANGFSVEGKARVLLGHDGDANEWGVSGAIKKTAGADGQGWSFALSPGYGDDAGDIQRLWEDGLRDGDGNGNATDTDDHDYAARLDLRVGYGMNGFTGPSWLGTTPGLLTPYTAMTLSDDSNRYRLGIQWKLGDRLDLDLVGEHRDADADDDAILLKGELRF